MMHVIHGHMESWTDIEWKYGAFLLKERNPVLWDFLKKEAQSLTDVIHSLEQVSGERAKERLDELKHRLKENQEAQKYMKQEKI